MLSCAHDPTYWGPFSLRGKQIDFAQSCARVGWLSNRMFCSGHKNGLILTAVRLRLDAVN